jgi:fructose-1,6-bisphosphatase/inositol monophosphatase family enzyme
MAGEGAWRDIQGRVQPLDPLRAVPLDRLVGSLGPGLSRRLTARRQAGEHPLPERFVRYGSSGREYMDLAEGRLDFARYSRLKPWDHAAGVLIHGEAGGFSQLIDGRSYSAASGIMEGTLLLAPDEATWHRLRHLLDER